MLPDRRGRGLDAWHLESDQVADHQLLDELQGRPARRRLVESEASAETFCKLVEVAPPVDLAPEERADLVEAQAGGPRAAEVPAEVRDNVVNALVDIAGTDEGKAALETLYEIAGLVPVDDSFYDAFRIDLDASGFSVEDFQE